MPNFLPSSEKLKLIIHTAALLNGLHGPEKNLKSIDPTHFQTSMSINCYALIQMYQELLPSLTPPTSTSSPFFINLSARVGSTTDDKSGGWWSYRISKTASNHSHLLAHIETNRQRYRCCFMSVHPGTTYTDLSRDFVKGVGGKVHSKEFTSERILELIGGGKEESSGGFFDWSGQSLPF
ncbi:hypothetical protein TrST_g10771 [Triparma strigata]|uniref:Uncharacterized protein n=2 Tax=Triparma TaxID=722752 RepID=A0A9W7BV69_9STRA|nr:hypothetical protein TrST_g10771 [Triparma strigata]